MQFKGTGSLLVKDLDIKQGIVQAYWSAFGNKDDGGDIVMPGCWRKSVKERGPVSSQPRIKFLYQHEEKMLLGKPTELVEDSFGLLATTPVVPTTLGRDVLLLYEAGVLSEHSVGYETVQSQWDTKSSARLLIECVLWEGSVVTWGMNSETPVVALKSLTQPEHLSALATKAAAIDNLLHNGNLRSDAICETLERELKALQTALAPSRAAASQPYSIQGVLDSMNDLVGRLSGKAATQADKDAQEARSKKYGIGIKDGGNVTKPGKYASLSDDDFADPVNYSYPLDTKAHADNAASRFGDPDNRAVYTKAEQGIIDKRIAAAQKKFGEDDGGDGGKGARMNTRLVKGTGGEVAVSTDGTHEAYSGTHTHSHKAYGYQGDDDMHEHKHTHDGNADHDHPADHKPHGAGAAESSSRRHPHSHKAPGDRPVRKARDFSTLFASLNASDQLQDDWGDTFIAFVQCMEELMWQASAQANGWTPDGADTVDIGDAAQSNLNAFTDAVMDLVNRSVAADFVPQMTCDRDQFIDPDGPNAESDDYDDWKSRTSTPLQPTPANPQRMKAGRAFSATHRDEITKALNGIADGVATINEHHGAIKSLLEKTDPDHTRQDEDTVLGDSDEENGGTSPNKGGRSIPNTPRRTAAEHTSQAGTTLDTSNILADLDSVVSRLKMAGKGK